MIGAVHGMFVRLTRQRWLSHAHGTFPWRQFSVADMAEMIAAGRRHLNLVRRHGRLRVMEAEQIAFECIADWSHVRGMMPQVLYDRYDRLRASGRDDTEAAVFPSVIAPAAIIASPHWLGLASTPAGSKGSSTASPPTSPTNVLAAATTPSSAGCSGSNAGASKPPTSSSYHRPT